MPTLTPNYSFQLPVVGADDDAWGGYLNSNWSEADTRIKANEDAIAALALSTQTPVGGLYLSTTDTDPAATLGYGTWAEHAAGRALIGVGDNTESVWAVDDTRGSETHTLTEAEMPSHAHGPGNLSGYTSYNGDHTHNYTDGFVTGTSFVDAAEQLNAVVGSVGSDRTLTTGTVNGGTHNHTVFIDGGPTAASGSNAAHNNIQPSIAVYVWRRTA